MTSATATAAVSGCATATATPSGAEELLEDEITIFSRTGSTPAARGTSLAAASWRADRRLPIERDELAAGAAASCSTRRSAASGSTVSAGLRIAVPAAHALRASLRASRVAAAHGVEVAPLNARVSQLAMPSRTTGATSRRASRASSTARRVRAL
jgi:hypothetical protein